MACDANEIGRRDERRVHLLQTSLKEYVSRMKENQRYIYYVDIRELEESLAAIQRVKPLKQLGYEQVLIHDTKSFNYIQQLKEYGGFMLKCV